MTEPIYDKTPPDIFTQAHLARRKTEQEPWTAEMKQLIREIYSPGCNSIQDAYRLADKRANAINAAIAQYTNLKSQGWFHPDIVNGLREQLAAAQDAVLKLSGRNINLTTQLAAAVEALEEITKGKDYDTDEPSTEAIIAKDALAKVKEGKQ